jgi:putative CocE/NonD family hydrolase
MPVVSWFDMGDRTWHNAPSWRAAATTLTTFRLSGAVSGSATSLDDGSLATKVPTGRAAYQDSYVYSPTAGASVPMGKEGPDGFAPYVHGDQRVDDLQGLTYTTPVLTKPLRLAGPSELRFWALSEASDMAWVVRLSDVAPDGSQKPITQGWLRASFRHVDPARSRAGAPYLTDDRKLPVPIGQTTQYRLDIWDAAYSLPAGHRLRLWLTSSDSPTHEPLPQAGRNLIFHDASHPSSLILNTR